MGCTIRGIEGTVFSISHIFYVDNTIIFYEAKDDQILYLNLVLLWFEASSRLKINLDKSELILVGVVDNQDTLVAELGCRTKHLPTIYLGLPLGATHKYVVIWDNIEEKMHTISMEKKLYLKRWEDRPEQEHSC